MTYYDKKTIERVKRFSLVDILCRDGLTLKKTGKDYFTCCPFHDDKTPSFCVTPDKNLWHCLGACQTGGSPIDYVMQRDGVSFKVAVGTLLDEHGEQAIEHQPIADNSALNTKVSRQDDVAQHWLTEAISLYHDNLKASSQAKAYLTQRGLDNPKLTETFMLGYAQKNLGTRLPTRTSQAGKEARTHLKEIGLTLDSGMERFSGSLVVPVIHQGKVLEIYGRKVAPDNKLRPGTAKHLYLPGTHDGVWNQQGLMGDTVILCEALIDAMSFWVHGFTHVTCSYGVNGITPSHLAVFNGLGIKRVLIAYDNDEAGNKAAMTLADTLRTQGMAPWRVCLPVETDVNAFMVASTQPTRDLESLLNQAVSMMGKDEAVADSLTDDIPASDSAPPLSALSLPTSPLSMAQCGDDWHIHLANRHYRVRGLSKTSQGQQLRINLMLKVNESLHVDSVDLYHAKQRSRFIEQATQECGVGEALIRQDMGRLLLALEELQQPDEPEDAPEPAMTEKERQGALALLRHPALLDEIVADFTRCGVVGEQSNTLVGYLACVSRKLDKPLALVIQSSSAAGKSALMDAILNMCPDEDVTQFSAMTGQSLFYMEGASLKHRILAISEEEGASQAAYALKLLQSQGVLTMASTGKDPVSGQLVTQTYEVEGPTMLFLTTTAIDVDEELMNRCLVLSVNESREQTRHIHALQRQRRTLDGLLQRSSEKHILTRHQHAQRLLRPLHVVNPYAEHLTFMDDKTRTRRDHEKYLTLIDTIALLHQYQREVKQVSHHGEVMEYVEVTLEDIHRANQLAQDTLGRTLDELPAQTRKLLNHCVDWVSCQAKVDNVNMDAVRFTRKQLREATGWSDTALKVHLARLVEMEYLLTHINGHRQRHHYELLYQPDASNQMLLKLMDVENERLKKADRSGQNINRSGAGQAAVRGMSGSGQAVESAHNLNDHGVWQVTGDEIQANALIPEKNASAVKVSS
jgi:DNA primase catalytic core